MTCKSWGKLQTLFTQDVPTPTVACPVPPLSPPSLPALPTTPTLPTLLTPLATPAFPHNSQSAHSFQSFSLSARPAIHTSPMLASSPPHSPNTLRCMYSDAQLRSAPPPPPPEAATLIGLMSRVHRADSQGIHKLCPRSGSKLPQLCPKMDTGHRPFAQLKLYWPEVVSATTLPHPQNLIPAHPRLVYPCLSADAARMRFFLQRLTAT